MDPTQCFLELKEAWISGDLDRARELAESLRDWLRNGGFTPQGVPPSEVEQLLRDVLDVEQEQSP